MPKKIGNLEAKTYYFVGMRTTELPVPYVPSDKLSCLNCRRSVWCDKKLTDYADKATGILCVECMMIMESKK